MVNSFKLLSYNCCGLNNPIKLKHVSNLLTKERPGVVFLQETHQKKVLPKILKSNSFDLHFQAPNSSKARGVAIVFSKHIPLHNPEVLADPRGRYIFLNCSIDDRPLTFASIYAPNTNQIQFLSETLASLNSFKKGDLLIGGDFNQINNPLLDKTYKKSYKKKLHTTQEPFLDSLFSSCNVSDTWRRMYPTSRAYTYYSPLHNIHSRIDYILCSDSLFHCCVSADIGSRTISDHSLISGSFVLHSLQVNGFHWSMPKFLLHDEISRQSLELEIKQYFDLNSKCGVTQETVWDAFKAVVRGQMISLPSAYKKEKSKVVLEIKSKIQLLEERLLKFGGNKTLRKLRIQRNKLELYETSKIQQDLLYLKQKFATKSPHSIRWLKWKLEKVKASRMVTALKSKDQTVLHKIKDIVRECFLFYQSLYSSDHPPNAEISSFFLRDWICKETHCHTQFF